MEDLLDGDEVRPVLAQRLREAVVQPREPLFDGPLLAERQHAVLEVPHAGAAVLDDAEPAVSRSGIDPEDAQVKLLLGGG
jgi:hypothetical protein